MGGQVIRTLLIHINSRLQKKDYICHVIRKHVVGQSMIHSKELAIETHGLILPPHVELPKL